MTMDEKIARINALAHKAKAEGLTDEEKEEQAQLRRDYIDSVKANLNPSSIRSMCWTKRQVKRRRSSTLSASAPRERARKRRTDK